MDPVQTNDVQAEDNVAGAEPNNEVKEILGDTESASTVQVDPSTKSGQANDTDLSREKEPQASAYPWHYDIIADACASAYVEGYERAHPKKRKIDEYRKHAIRSNTLRKLIEGRLRPETASGDAYCDGSADAYADSCADAYADEIADQWADEIADQWADEIADQWVNEMADQMEDEEDDAENDGDFEDYPEAG